MSPTSDDGNCDCEDSFCNECGCCVNCVPGHVDGCYGILDDALRAVDYLLDVYSSDDPADAIPALLKNAESALRQMFDITKHHSDPSIEESVGPWSGTA